MTPTTMRQLVATTKQIERLLSQAQSRRFASTEAVNAAAAAVSAASSTSSTTASTVAEAVNTSANFIANLPVHQSVVGKYPDYSILQKTGDVGGFTDTLMHWMQFPYELMHDTLGMPWWAAIVAGTVGFRLVLGRSMVRAIASGANMQEHMDEIQAFQKRIQAAQQGGDMGAVMGIRGEMKAFMKKRSLNMMTPFIPLLQAPILFSLFWAIGRLARDAHMIPGFYEGGFAWFPVLTAPDPTMILPTVAVAGSLLSIWTNPVAQGIPAAELTAKGQKVMFSSLALVFSYVTFTFPAVSCWCLSASSSCSPLQLPLRLLFLIRFSLSPFLALVLQALQLYVGTTAVSMLAQQALLRSSSFKKLMGFPESWPPSPEKAAAMAKKRGFTAFTSMAPLFRRFSALAEGDVARFFNGAPAVPKQVYVTAFGLRDPGAPPPPPESQQPLFASTAAANDAGKPVIFNNPAPPSASAAAATSASPSSSSAAQPAAAQQQQQQQQKQQQPTPPVKMSLSSLKNKGSGKR